MSPVGAFGLGVVGTIGGAWLLAFALQSQIKAAIAQQVTNQVAANIGGIIPLNTSDPTIQNTIRDGIGVPVANGILAVVGI